MKPNKELTPAEVIAAIRKDEYLLDLVADRRIQDGVASMHRKLDSALRLLSEDLYSKQTHFVLELVQNADDNQYAPGVIPRLKFSLSPDRLIVTNNETGFTSTNVRALCNVGESSKANKSGYIGEKGIGFKSVFTVSDAPEIHSNGFHFRFNRTDSQNLLGYVVPEPVTPSGELDPKETTIVLPVKQGAVFSDDTLSELDGRLLLFLIKIRTLVVQTGGEVLEHVRRDKKSVVQITTQLAKRGQVHQSIVEHFIRLTHGVSMADIADEKRSGIEKSELVLAFPVSKTKRAEPTENCDTYAFLPIRGFGFRFYIHADFLLSASREDIHTEREWNLRLRDSIADAFVGSLDVFKKHKEFAKTFMRFVPSEGDLSSAFFKPVVSSIESRLKGAACILGASGEWRRPAEILMAPAVMRELFGPKEMLEVFGLEYVDENFEVDGSLLQRLGCVPLRYDHLVALFSRHGSFVTNQPREWKAKLFAFLSLYQWQHYVNAGLTRVPCIPIRDGTLAVPEEESVFLPLNNARNYGFEHELKIADSEVIELAEGIDPKASQFFVNLGVKRDVPYEMVQGFILPRHAGEKWMDSDEDALVGHIRYLKDRFDDYIQEARERGITFEKAIVQLQAGLWIGTKKSEVDWTFNRPTNLYFSRAYKPQFCIESTLGQEIAPELLVSDIYLPTAARGGEHSNAESELKSWKDFFAILGITDAPKVEKDELGGFKCSEELSKLIHSAEWHVRKSLLECVDRNWPKYSGKLQYIKKSGAKSYITCPSQFANELRQMQTPSRKKVAAPLHGAFLRTLEIVSVLGDSPTYIAASLHSEELMKFCGITFRMDHEACLKRIRQIKAEGIATIHQLGRIYRQLELQAPKHGDAIRKCIEEERLIYVKSDADRWVSPSAVYWRRSAPFLDKLYPPLQGLYGDFHAFFVRVLGVPQEMPLETMIAALVHVEKIEDREERAAEALNIYKRASRELTARQNLPNYSRPRWLAQFESESVFIDQFGKLVKRENLFVDDSTVFRGLFYGESSISLLDIRQEELPRVERLLKAVDVAYLSSSVITEVVDIASGIILPELSQRAELLVNCFARVLYWRDSELFESARDRKLFSQIRDIQVVEVSKISLRLKLAGIVKETEGDVASDGTRLIIRRGDVLVNDRLALHIANLLQAPLDVVDTFGRLLIAETLSHAEAFLQAKGISNLPPADELELAAQVSDISASDSAPDENLSEGESRPTEEGGFAKESASSAENHSKSEVESDSRSNQGSESEQPIGRPTEPSGPQSHDKRPSKPVSPRPAADSTTPKGSGTPSQKSLGRSKSNGTKQGAKPPAKSPAENGKRSRLLSYAERNASDDSLSTGDEDTFEQTMRDEISRSAVSYFLTTQSKKWKSLEEMPPNNPGFDVKGVSFEGIEEFIEVKGQSGPWSAVGVAVTPRELQHAIENRARYWLCVVEYALDENRRNIFLIKDPFGQTDQFRYDSGWKDVAVKSPAIQLKPEPGLFVEVLGEGKGKILSVKKAAQFYKLHIVLSGNRQLFKTFNPQTMKLSTD